MTDAYRNPALAAAASVRAEELCPLPSGRERGDGTPEGTYQVAFELGAEFGHLFPRLADPSLRGTFTRPEDHTS